MNLLFLKQPAVSEWELTDFSLSVKNYVCVFFIHNNLSQHFLLGGLESNSSFMSDTDVDL